MTKELKQGGNLGRERKMGFPEDTMIAFGSKSYVGNCWREEDYRGPGRVFM